MKKIICASSVLIALFLASCSSNNHGEFAPLNKDAEGITVANLDEKEKDQKDDIMTLDVEKKEQLTIVFIPAYATNKGEFSFTYKSSNPEAATIDEKGLIKTGENAGETKITVTPTNNPAMVYEYTVKVIKNDLVSIATEEDYEKGVDLRFGEQLEIGQINFTPKNTSYKDLVFASADKTIATVDTLLIPDGKDSAGKEKFRKAMGIIASKDKSGTTQITISSKKYPSINQIIEVRTVDVYTLAKTGWTIEMIDYPENIVDLKGGKEALIDEDVTTYMSLAKPGKLGVDKEARPSFAIDRGNQEIFSAIQVIHSGVNITQRISSLSIYGRNSIQKDWTLIGENIQITDIDKEKTESPLIEIAESSYQLIKVDILGWNIQLDGKETIEIAELNFVGYKAK